MQIKTRVKEEITVLDLEGQFDMEAQKPVESAVKGHLTSKGGCVIWNFDNINIITGAGIAILFNACSDISKHGGLTTMVNVKPAVIDALEVHKMLQGFNILANEEAAIKQICLCREDMSHMHKRLFARADVDLKAVFRKFKVGRDAHLFTSHEARLSSLSRRGGFIQTNLEYPAGTVLEIDVEIDKAETGRPLRFLAKVVRISDEFKNDTDTQGMAFSIVNIEEDEGRRLDEFLLPFGG